jgi:aspartyl-tRNA(Asn)/glutamyl-tRNA(Gln) amidotransferase subunit A
MASKPIFRPIRELSEPVRAGKISPVELTETFLGRLEELGPRYNAVVTVTRERALKQARRAEEEIASGHYRGPLHGIPYGGKDLLATSGGIPTSWGAAPFKDRTFDHDATVVRKLEEAGAVLVAKLAMIELAGGMGYRQPHASFTGPPRNPWNTDTWTGGSSSGSGAAVSAGLVPFAIGSETWGSILSPANNCGVAGLRPTYGRVSRSGAMALSWTLDKLGPLCLTADDCGLVLEAIAGPDPNDPTTTDRPFKYDSEGPKKGFKLAVLKGNSEGVHEGVLSSSAPRPPAPSTSSQRTARRGGSPPPRTTTAPTPARRSSRRTTLRPSASGPTWLGPPRRRWPPTTPSWRRRGGAPRPPSTRSSAASPPVPPGTSWARSVTAQACLP